MLTPEENAFNEAVSAVQKGEKSRARDLLTRLIKTNANSPQYWLYMSAVVESDQEIIYCLKEVLKRDPQNPTARRGLIYLGELPPDPNLAVPLRNQRRNWEAGYFAGLPVPGMARSSWLRLGVLAGSLVVLGLVVWLVIAGLNRVEVPAFVTWLQRYTPAPTSNEPTVQATLAQTVPAAATTTPAPLGFLPVDLTLTPTPLYVNTPHPRTESYRSALSAYLRSDWPAAVTYLQQAIKEDPKADLEYLLGEVLRFQKKPKEAGLAYDQAILLDPRFAPPYLGRARLRLAANPDQTDLIRADLEKAVSLDPNFVEAYLELAGLKLTRKESAAALTNLDSVLRLSPLSAQAYFLRGRAYLQLNQPDLAAAETRKALLYEPSMLPAYRQLGEALRAANDLPGAIAALEIYTRYSNDDFEALLWTGQAYFDQKNYPAAIKVLDKAITLNNLSYDAHILRAFAYLEGPEPQKSQEDLRLASLLRANSFLVSLGQGRAALAAGELTAARTLLTAALNAALTDADRAQGLYWRALALEANKLPTVAVLDWNELLRLPEKSVPPEFRATALQHLQALATLTPTPRPNTPTPTQTLTPTAGSTVTLTPPVLPTPTR